MHCLTVRAPAQADLHHPVPPSLFTVFSFTRYGQCTDHLIGQHVVLRPENMPQPNIEPESFESPQISSGGCQVWGFRLCKTLANSTQSKDALKNAESLAAICLFLYLLVLWPEWDLTSGRAVRRPPAAGWLKDYDLNK